MPNKRTTAKRVEPVSLRNPPAGGCYRLARMHMDHESIMAALLHDVIEDTGVTKEDIRTQFGGSCRPCRWREQADAR